MATNTTPHDSPTRTLDDWRQLAVVPVWSPHPPSAAHVLGISRDLAYAQARTGDLPSIRLGKRLLVPVAMLRAMLGELPEADGSAGERA